MIDIRQIFTWWHRQTLGTFLKTLFFGKFVGKDESGNKYYTCKKGKRWVIYENTVEATRIESEWFLWIHHTTDEIPKNNTKKHLWQKNHSENKTGSKDAYKPNRISKINNKLKKYESWKI